MIELVTMITLAKFLILHKNKFIWGSEDWGGAVSGRTRLNKVRRGQLIFSQSAVQWLESKT